MRNIVVDFPSVLPVEKQRIELVERKGIGHPDSICDGIAEAVSRGLSKEYLKRYGRVLHHNTDQVELVGGQASPRFGGGDAIKPIYILLSGRAMDTVNGENIPTHEIAVDSARNYLKDNFEDLDSDNFVVFDPKIGRGSADLQHVFKKDGIPKSNDTSFGVGFAPFSTVENIVYETERYINGKMGMKETGEDVKVMGQRDGDKIHLTVACAMVAGYIDDLDAYKSAVEEMHGKVADYVSKLTEKEVRLEINTADDYEEGSIYLTLTGLSAEQGDDGSVGRGNRANGLITPYRPMSLEATAGKNPINHVGKIYNLLSSKIAADIAAEGAEQAYVRLLSQIGRPIDDPLIASVEVIGDAALKDKARRITDEWLARVTDITELCVQGKACTF